MNDERFQRIAVVGLGLIGGSLVRSLRRVTPERKLIGVDHPPVLARARALLDEAHPPVEIEKALREADLVFVATPIGITLQLLPTIASAIPRGALVTDVGSTKREIIALAAKHFVEERYFIGGHPMAGKEKGGWENSAAGLFESAAYVLTPSQNFPAPILEELQSLLRKLGARVMVLEAAEHDRIAAEISHLPQLLAVALLNFIAREGAASAPRLQLAANGLRDMTRIAASPFDIWRDIFHTNQTNVREALREFMLVLQRLENDLGSESLGSSFQRANALRGEMFDWQDH